MVTKQAAISALNKLISAVYVPTFLAKLAADYDIQPQSEADLANLMQMAAFLATAREQAKTAAANSPNPVSVFLQDAVNNLTAKAGIKSSDLQSELITQKVLSDMVKSDKQLKEAALVYGYIAGGGRPQ